jgi:UDP-N-acetyl-D-mannosaminuronic acid dehydrogenase
MYNDESRVLSIFNGESTVCVVGLGYIGLPTAALMASRGWRVIGVDTNERIVEKVASGKVHIVEPDLDALVKKVVSTGRLRTSTEPVSADVFVITVPTPLAESKRPDCGFVVSAIRSIAPKLRPGNLVILESTCPVGTTAAMSELIASLRPDLYLPGGSDDPAANIYMAYCPERVLPGRILLELQENDRSIGGVSEKCTERAVEFYKTFVNGKCTGTTSAVAEMVKLSENAFRDLNIAFANELSIISDRVGVDVWEVIRLANHHPRVNILQPGPGVGGHCIAVDPWFLVDLAPDLSPLIRTAREVNDGKADYIYRKADRLLEENRDQRLACLGIAFKANIDDFRESPSLEIAERLAAKFGNRISIVEPHAAKLPGPLTGSGAQHASLEDALSSCAILLLLVDHDEFKEVPRDRLEGKIIIDTRGIWKSPTLSASVRSRFNVRHFRMASTVGSAAG